MAVGDVHVTVDDEGEVESHREAADCGLKHETVRAARYPS